MAEPLAVLCGQLLVVGLAGTELSASERRSLSRGERGGVVLFERNLEPGLPGIERLLGLTRAIHEAAALPGLAPPLVSIDQEGGRVVRIKPPALALPAMRRIGDLGDDALARRLAEAQARELAALGFTLSFGPIADIHTRPENPVIGNRSFAETPEVVARFAAAWAEGLVRGGVLSCAKHFPGHGDTTVDSHVALPQVARSRHGLDEIEIAPFRALAKNPSVTAMMSAHVIFSALDTVPATLSRKICTDLLRTELGFSGVIFSDDMEMKAIQLPIGEAVVQAMNAGCDALLVCHGENLAEEARGALVREAEASAAFRARCEEAYRRFSAMRRRLPLRIAAGSAAIAAIFEGSAPIAAELAQRLAAGDRAS
jgi:beta-N-acetylhexosaminidase